MGPGPEGHRPEPASQCHSLDGAFQVPGLDVGVDFNLHLYTR